MKSSLQIALIHFDVLHKETARNRDKLLSLVADAARNGAKLVVAPEMSISGYAFDSRKDILPHAESQDGPTISALANAAGKLGIYVCIGMAEINPDTGILYNSAFALDPVGRIQCRYRKINNELSILSGIATSRQVHVAARNLKDPDRTCHLFEPTGRLHSFPLPSWPFDGDGSFPRVDVGPARLLFVPFAAMRHPEPAVGAAKLGCDVAIALEDRIAPEDRLLAGVRTIENLAVAVCGKNDAGIWLPPEGHQRWKETSAGPAGVCRCALDTHATRRKRFQDSIDFERLLQS